jgi:pSer/pThr/pTyr-binding forkhead associated (FHA) protein
MLLKGARQGAIPSPGTGGMSSAEITSTSSDEVVVQLLDAAIGRPVKTWRFTDRQVISIGRLPDRDVEINDPYVSRLHAELRFSAERWTLVSLGQNGIVVQHQQITELAVDSEVTFQLGAKGPRLRFATQAKNDESEASRTLCFDSVEFPEFIVDQSKLLAEVDQIVGDDYFQKLQSQAKSLRAARQ